MSVPVSYVVSLQIDNLIATSEGKEQIKKLDQALRKPDALINPGVTDPTQPGYVHAEYIPGSLTLNFSLSAPVGLVQQDLLLKAWAKVLQESKFKSFLPPPPPKRKPTIQDDFNEINRLLNHDHKRLNEIKQDLTNLIQRLRNPHKKHGKKKKNKRSKMSSDEEGEMSSATMMMNDLVTNLDQYVNVLNQIGQTSSDQITDWKLPDLNDLKELINETGFVTQKIENVMEEIVEEYLNMIPSSEGAECDISSPCLQLKDAWAQKFIYSTTPELRKNIDKMAAQSGPIWQSMIQLRSDKAQALEEALMLTAIHRLRQLSLETQDRLFVYVDDSTGRWFAAKNQKNPTFDQAFVLPYSMDLPLADIYLLRFSQCDAATQKALRPFQEEGQKQFATLFQKVRRPA